MPTLKEDLHQIDDMPLLPAKTMLDHLPATLLLQLHITAHYCLLLWHMSITPFVRQSEVATAQHFLYFLF
jgi:hypothetical protein